MFQTAERRRGAMPECGRTGEGSAIDTIVGRDAELDAIAAFLQAAEDGPRALVLRGEPGAGKTTLWRRGLALATEQAFCVLVARPSEAEAQLPYAGLGDLMTPVSSSQMADLPAAQRRAVEIALLREAPDGPSLQQRAVAVGVHGILGRLAEQQPTLIAIDDTQWIDGPSARVLEFAFRRLEARSILILASSRAARAAHDLLGLRRALPEGHVGDLDIGPLAEADVERLLRDRLGLALPRPTLRRLHQTAAGNPLFALELGRALAASRPSDEPDVGIPLPDTLREVVLERLYRLPGTVREVLVVMAALSRPTVSLVRAVTDDTGRARAAIDRAVEARVIEIDGELLRFVHPLVGSALYAELSRDARRALHRRLAALSSDPDEQARHLALGADRPAEDVAAALDLAAQRARARGAPDAAATLTEHARRLTPTDRPGDATRRAIDAGVDHLEAGDGARAARILEPVIDTVGSGADQARALLALGRVRMFNEGLHAAQPLLERAAVAAGDEPGLLAAIWRDLGIAIAQAGDLRDALAAAQRTLEWAERAQQEGLIAEALVQLASARFLLGQGINEDLLERAARIEASEDRTGRAPATAFVPVDLVWGALLKWSDRFADARGRFEVVRQQAVARGDETPWVSILFQHGELELWAGDWVAAAETAAEARSMSRRRLPAMQDDSAYLVAAIEAHRGDLAAARPTAQMALTQADRTGDVRFLIRAHALLGFVELSATGGGAALPHLERAHEAFRDCGYDDPGVVRFIPDLVEARVATGRIAEAEGLNQWLADRGRVLDRPYALATAARGRALLLTAIGDVTGAAGALEEALMHHQRLPQPFERARTQLVRGGVLRRLKAKRDARAALMEAVETFETLGATGWLARARSELARIGGRPPSTGGLTPTESQVAALAAQGFGNQEIADVLFVSVKTVETHLTRVYDKLGVRSRGELIRRSRSGEVPDVVAGPGP